MGGRSRATNGRASHPKRSTCRVAAATGVSDLQFSLSVKHDAWCPREAGSRTRRLLSRGFAVLGGSVAGTAVAWAIAAGTAAADELSLDSRLTSVAASESSDVLADVTSTLARESSLDALDGVLGSLRTRSAAPLRMNLSQDGAACAAHVLECAGSVGGEQAAAGSADAWDETSVAAEQPHTVPARTLTAAHEVVATEVRESVRQEAGHVPARQLRTTSGPDEPAEGTGDASAHTPAPVPLAATAPAASGCATGSSLMSTFASQLCEFDALGAGSSEVILPDDAGRPNTTGAQPGVAPD